MPDSNAKTRRVPWKSTVEWLLVKNKVVSQNQDDLIRAYQLMLMWKARCSNLPANVECTLGILQVLIMSNDLDSNKNTLFSKEEDLQLCYSTALLRFVNHVSASTSPLGDTLYLVAHKQNIPDWVVNLRHDIAHSATLPPLSLLESAILLGKQWLIENYWEPGEKNMISVDGSSMKLTTNPSTGFVQAILKEAIQIWWICRLKKLISDLTDTEWLTLLNVCERVSDYKLIRHERAVQNLKLLIEPCEMERTKSSGNKNLLEKVGLNILQVLEILYRKESNKLNKYFLEGLEEAGFLKASGSNLMEWAPLLKVFHKVDSLQVLFDFLFEKLNGVNVENTKYAEGWLKALAPSLNNLRCRWQRSIGVENSELRPNSEDILALSVRPPPFFKFEILRPCLMNPNDSSFSIFTTYSKFANPKLPKHARSLITDLLMLYSNEPIDDIPQYPKDLNDVQLFSIEDLKVNSPTISTNNHEISENNGKWKKVTVDTEEWRRCSIGMLPNQFDPNFELPSMRWYQEKHNSRKRKAVEELWGEKTNTPDKN